MRKGHFTRGREIRRVQDAVNDRYTVNLGCTHSFVETFTTHDGTDPRIALERGHLRRFQKHPLLSSTTV